MRYLGITSMGHDASVCLMDEDRVVFATHQERFSGNKNDGMLSVDLVNHVNELGYDRVVWYEKPWLKALRQVTNGQFKEGVATLGVEKHLRELGVTGEVFTVGHHESHAAGGYFTSGFTDAVVLVCDAIGEFDTISVWKGEGNNLTKIHSQKYPHSLGLFYSAFTQRVGKKPNEEEYIMMGMAALGNPDRLYQQIVDDFVHITPGGFPTFTTKVNLHRGCRWWKPELMEEQDLYDIAAAVQKITEDYLVMLCMSLRDISHNLVISGGVALNCKANTQIAEDCSFENIWIMPNPGDAGSSMGAILAHRRKHIGFPSVYLGRSMEGECDFQGALGALVAGDVIGLAFGRSEWGPRALGHRSILADPRGGDVKDKVNAFKRREPFRPFAPIILEEYADDYFVMPVPRTPYMQFTATCKYPEQFPAICHYDGTSRVQTISKNDCPVMYSFLSEFHKRTGCPMLLNTSMNIKGKPLVDTRDDALLFQRETGIAVY